jgi:hypothetical protein
MNVVIDIDRYRAFVPEFNGNKELPAEKQIRVELVNPTTKLVNELIDRPKLLIRTDADNKVTGGEMPVEVDIPRILHSMVKSIYNLSYTKGGAEVTVTSADDLYSKDTPSEFQELIDELGKECQRRLSFRLDVKNSE